MGALHSLLALPAVLVLLPLERLHTKVQLLLSTVEMRILLLP